MTCSIDHLLKLFGTGDDPIHDIIRPNSESRAETHSTQPHRLPNAHTIHFWFGALVLRSVRSVFSLSSPNISVYFIQDLDMPLFKLVSFFGFGFCAFLFDLIFLFWILCSLGSRFCAKSNLLFGRVIFICFFVVFSVLILYFFLFLWHKIQWRYISINRIYLIYFF